MIRCKYIVFICPERSSAWLEHLLWEQDVAGSNPVAPTIFFKPILNRRLSWNGKNCSARICLIRVARSFLRAFAKNSPMGLGNKNGGEG